MRSPIGLWAISAVALLASLAGAETVTVPLNIEGARILVTVRVNDKTARLLLDTGEGMTLVGPKVAQGIIELQRLNIESQAGISQASIRHLSITLGELTFKDHVVGVLDMTDVNSRTGASMDGLRGEDILLSLPIGANQLQSQDTRAGTLGSGGQS